LELITSMQMTQLRCREDLRQEVISDDSKPAGVPVMPPIQLQRSITVNYFQHHLKLLETPTGIGVDLTGILRGDAWRDLL